MSVSSVGVGGGARCRRRRVSVRLREVLLGSGDGAAEQLHKRNRAGQLPAEASTHPEALRVCAAHDDRHHGDRYASRVPLEVSGAGALLLQSSRSDHVRRLLHKAARMRGTPQVAGVLAISCAQTHGLQQYYPGVRPGCCGGPLRPDRLHILLVPLRSCSGSRHAWLPPTVLPKVSRSAFPRCRLARPNAAAQFLHTPDSSAFHHSISGSQYSPTIRKGVGPHPSGLPALSAPVIVPPAHACVPGCRRMRRMSGLRRSHGLRRSCGLRRSEDHMGSVDLWDPPGCDGPIWAIGWAA